MKWTLYFISWGTIVAMTWGMPDVNYFVVQAAVLGVFVSGAMR